MSAIRRWLETQLGVTPAAAGEDTVWRWRFNLGWPDWVVFLFVSLATAFIVALYLRERTNRRPWIRWPLAAIRLAVIALILAMLGQLEVSIDRTGLPFLVVMVDDSQSMGTRDRTESSASTPVADNAEPTRLDRVSDWLRRDQGNTLVELTRRYKLQLYAHSSAPRLLGTALKPAEVGPLLDSLASLEPNGNESRLGQNLRSVLNTLRGAPPSAVLMISDGVVTEGETLSQSAAFASRKGIPLYTVGVGDPGRQVDVEVHDLLVDHTVFVDDLVAFEAKLTGKGAEGRDVVVRLKRKGASGELDKKTFRIPSSGGPLPIRLLHRPTQPGLVDYVLEADLLPRETQQENNKIERQIEVVKEKVRVLYVDGYPRYEFRFLKSLLERDPTIELGTMLLDADPEFTQQDRSAIGFFPTNKKELFAFDVLILGDVSPAMFSSAQLDMIREFVKNKGGGLLFLAGVQFSPVAYKDTPLADLLPIDIGATANRDISTQVGFVPRLTLEGKSSPIFRFAADEVENESIWTSLPQSFWYARVDKVKPGAQVLLEHPTDAYNGAPIPLAATQFFGAGRTYYQGFDSSWRWRKRVEDRYFSRYWVQAIRFLSRAKLLGKNRSVELIVDRQRYRRGEPVSLRLRFLDESQAPRPGESATITLEQGNQSKSVTLTSLPDRPTLFEGVLPAADVGRYQVRLISPKIEGNQSSAEFIVTPPPGELDRLRMDEAEMRQAAEVTRGEYRPLATADELWELLPEGRRVALRADPPIALWNTWPMLILFTALLALEWIVRKTQSML